MRHIPAVNVQLDLAISHLGPTSHTAVHHGPGNTPQLFLLPLPTTNLPSPLQKAAKTTARRNAATLLRTHSITFSLHLAFILLRLIFRFPIRSSPSLKRYILFSLPSLAIEFYLERLGRPTFSAANGELIKSGEDLEAKGLTEWMWDVVYWSWGNLALVTLMGDWAWWLWAVVPLYSAWLAYSTFAGLRSGMAGMAGAGGDAAAMSVGGESKRQKKMEKRGGQKVQYR